MKCIPLKIVPLVVDGQEGKFDYKAQIAAILRTPSNPQIGADYDEIRKSIRILDILEAAEGEIKLEDADHEYLQGRVMGARFVVIAHAVEAFIEDVIDPK